MLSVNRKTMQHSWRTSDSTKSAIEGCEFDQRMEDQERKRGFYCYVEITPNIWYHNLKQSTGKYVCV